MENKRVLITVGGTGGHIYPAVALAKKLQSQGVQVLFVGGGLSSNRYFQQHDFPFREITCGFLSTKNPFKFFLGVTKVMVGVMQTFRILFQFKPQVVIGFGSYYTVSCLTAALISRYPVVLHEQNAVSGRVNRLFSKYADFTAVSIPDAANTLSGSCIEVEMPLRGADENVDPSSYFTLDKDLKTILVFGGSQGAEAINQCVLNAAPELKECQFLHFTGCKNSSRSAAEKYKEMGVKACVKSFEARMDLAWRMADFAVARAGAGTVAEAIEFAVPTLFVPFPRAMDNHQEKNADFMIHTVGGGCKILQPQLQKDLFVRTVKDSPVEKMKEAINMYKKSREACALESVILEKYL